MAITLKHHFKPKVNHHGNRIIQYTDIANNAVLSINPLVTTILFSSDMQVVAL